MKTIVISQPMLFPWVGLLEEIQLADVYVHHENIQWTKSGFVHRVQLKSPNGPIWLGVPLQKAPVEVLIEDIVPVDNTWRKKHLALLDANYRKAPHFEEMFEFAKSMYAHETETFCEFLMYQLEETIAYLGIAPNVQWERATSMHLETANSERVLDIIEHYQGTIYVTGHGARNYMDHEHYESRGVEVRYMDYAKTPYPQLNGDFTPYVSVLDLIANVGRENAINYFNPRTLNWREFLQQHQ